MRVRAEASMGDLSVSVAIEGDDLDGEPDPIVQVIVLFVRTRASMLGIPLDADEGWEIDAYRDPGQTAFAERLRDRVNGDGA